MKTNLLKQLSVLLPASVVFCVFPGVVSADNVILDDLIVDGSACIGLDCVNGESFGFDTIRLKENNLRIQFLDTSSSAAFPSVDWELTANDSGNGGANKFSITNRTTGAVPFTVLSGAPDNALFVDDQGDVGIGTASPIVELHMVDGDTPTVRLEQDGTSGFSAQTWDLAGNETNFFIRDTTHASKIPFKIIPDAPSNALVVATSGNIGFGIREPLASLHIKTSDAPSIRLENSIAGSAAQWTIKANANTGKMTFRNEVSGNTPFKFGATADNNLFKVGDASDDLVEVDGDLSVSGDLTISGQCEEADGACADYVFAPDYELLALDEVSAFIEANRHLPNIPSAAQMEAQGVNVATISGRLLAKIEELTLYTIAQEETINELSARVNQLEGQ